MIGSEDVIKNRKYSTTVKCISNSAVLYQIKAEEFIFRLSKEEKVWSILQEMSSEKDNFTKLKITSTTDKTFKTEGKHICDLGVFKNIGKQERHTLHPSQEKGADKNKNGDEKI